MLQLLLTEKWPANNKNTQQLPLALLLLLLLQMLTRILICCC
jgi:hypothetical protein